MIRRRVVKAGTPASAPTSARPGHVRCPYCSREIAAVDFTPWTVRTGLLSAGCQCGRTVTLAAVTLHRRTAVPTGQDAERDPDPDEVEEFELAFARLAWVRATNCLELPSQREALDWHQACCDAARAALEHRTSGRA